MEYGLSTIKAKWKPTIICKIKEFNKIRYNALHREIEDISHKILSQRLKELEKDEIIQKTVYNEKVPKVEYELTEKGIKIHKVLIDLKNLMEDYY